MTETPFKISISDESLNVLRKKLELTTFPDELEGAEWAYGAPLADIKRLTEHWRTAYDWRKHEAALNAELPQFTRDIQIEGHGTLNIHYVHKKSTVEGAIPLIFIHGWPGSFLEVRKLLPLLTEASPEHPSFHVVAISMPGYGFSEAPKEKGFAHKQIAEAANKLMLALGYDQYVAQGGDWGYFVSRKLANDYGGKHVKAWHTNFPLGEAPSPLWNPLSYASLLLTMIVPFWSPAEKRSLEDVQVFQRWERGYFNMHSTRPQTLGYSLADSPVGLLAWIYEKLHKWTDNYPWTDDEVLTWISIYWFSRGGPTSSIRLYYESQNGPDRTSSSSALKQVPSIPFGFSVFPRELVILPKEWVRRSANVVFEAEHTSGGHFAAWERPEQLAADLRKMFGKKGPAFRVVTGNDGYTAKL